MRTKTVVINLHIIGTIFVNIRIDSHSLHFHHSDWFQIVRDCCIYLHRVQSDKIFGQVGPALKENSFWSLLRADFATIITSSYLWSQNKNIRRPWLFYSVKHRYEFYSLFLLEGLSTWL